MISKFEATALTRSKVSARTVTSNWVGTVLVVLNVLAAIGLLRAVTGDRSSDVGLASVTTSAIVRTTERAWGARPAIHIPPSETGAQVPLFFGYVEFDWDPDKSGGVAGFGPWPPSSPIAAVPAAN